MIIILAVILIGFLVYNFSLKKKTAPATEPLPAEEQAGLPAQKIKPISQERVVSADLAPDDKRIRYYLARNGNLFETDFDGKNLRQISGALLVNLIKVLFSPTDKEKVIVILKEDGQIRKYFYDCKLGQSSQLHQNIQWIGWSPDGQQIVYQFTNLSKNVNNISLANPDGTNWKNIFETRLEDLIIHWPAKDKIALASPANGLVRSALYLINTDGSNFNKIIGDIYGLTIRWSPKGDKFIFSETDERGKNLKLNLADSQGQNQKILNITTLPEKCTWGEDNRTLFCAVPQEISPYITWPDDYKKGVISTEDNFYKIDLITEEKIKLFSPSKEKAFDAKDLFLSPQEDYLFFINQRDGLLYSLGLLGN